MKQFDTKLTISKKVVGEKRYYNLHIVVGDMTIAVQPRFLSWKQQKRLQHELARAMGDEKDVNK